VELFYKGVCGVERGARRWSHDEALVLLLRRDVMRCRVCLLPT